jgi:hypothetical protein
MGTYIHGINTTKQHKTYGTIGVMNFLYKPCGLWSSEKAQKWEEQTDRRILKRWATESDVVKKRTTWSKRWEEWNYTYVSVPKAWAFPRVVAMGKDLYYFKGNNPIWNDNYENLMVPLHDYIAQGGVVEVYDKTTKQLTPLPCGDAPTTKVSV